VTLSSKAVPIINENDTVSVVDQVRDNDHLAAMVTNFQAPPRSC
jgi:glutamate 5-kinase